MTRLRDLCQVNPGVPQWDRLDDDAQVPFLPMERVWTDRLDLSEVRPKHEVASGYTRFAEGDLLLPKITPTFEAGRAAVAIGLNGGIGTGTTELHVLRPNSRVHPRWLLHFLNSETFLRRGHADMYGVAGQKRISADFVKSYALDPPPLDEQQRIADYLDAETARIDELVDEAEKLRSLATDRLENERRLLLVDQSGGDWTVGRLKRFVRIDRGRFTHRPRNDPALYDGPFPFIQTGDIASATGGVIRQWSQSLNEQGLAVSRLAPASTLVMAIAANIGDVAFLGFDACFPDSVVALTPGRSVTDEYLVELVRALRPELVGSATLNTQLNINVDRIGDIEVRVPPLAEQADLVTHLQRRQAEVSALANEIEVEIALLRERRQALITHAVTHGIEGLPGVA